MKFWKTLLVVFDKKCTSHEEFLSNILGMIELFSKKRMLIGILALGGLSIIIIILENRNLHNLEEDIQNWHPDLKAKLTPDDKCWKNESFSILEKCDLCSGKKLNVNQFHGIFYNLKKNFKYERKSS